MGFVGGFLNQAYLPFWQIQSSQSWRKGKAFKGKRRVFKEMIGKEWIVSGKAALPGERKGSVGTVSVLPRR